MSHVGQPAPRFETTLETLPAAEAVESLARHCLKHSFSDQDDPYQAAYLGNDHQFLVGVKLQEAPSVNDPEQTESWISRVRVTRGGEDPFHLQQGLWFTLPYGNSSPNNRLVVGGFLHGAEAIHAGFSDGDTMEFLALRNFRRTGRTVSDIDTRLSLTDIDKELGFTLRAVMKELIWPQKATSIPVEPVPSSNVIPIRHSS